jgi:DNA-binding response OmpR family regulator
MVRVHHGPPNRLRGALIDVIERHRGCILVIEDEPRLRFIIHRQLQSAGFEVVPHEDGIAALRALETTTPDLVLLNVNLPSLDGFEICRRIRADRRLARVPVVFLTLLSDTESRQRATSVGANDYITKPWEASDLVSRISRLVHRPN